MLVSTGIGITFGNIALGEILDVTPPAASREAINVSYSSLTAHAFTPAKLYQWGELVVTIGFDPADMDNIVTDISAAAASCVITFVDSAFASGEIWTFTGFLINYEPEAPFEDKMTATVTIKVASTIALT